MVVMNERKYSVMELIKMLEETLPDGQVVVVGKGESLTDKHKAWLHSLTDCKGECDCEECDCDECEGYTQEEMDDAIEEAYEDGKADGYEEARRELADEYEDKLEELRETLHELINEYV
jgi:hypothetical protein